MILLLILALFTIMCYNIIVALGYQAKTTQVWGFHQKPQTVNGYQPNTFNNIYAKSLRDTGHIINYSWGYRG